jgi:hypothetical protein
MVTCAPGIYRRIKGLPGITALLEKSMIEYSELNIGYEFPPVSFSLDSTMVADYIKAVGEISPLYQEGKLVPPMAVAAFAMAELSKGMSLSSGTIHVSQEIELMDLITTNSIVTSHAKVSRKQKRGNLHLMTIDINILDQNNKTVLYGKTEFVLTESNIGTIGQ